MGAQERLANETASPWRNRGQLHMNRLGLRANMPEVTNVRFLLSNSRNEAELTRPTVPTLASAGAALPDSVDRSSPGTGS